MVSTIIQWWKFTFIIIDDNWCFIHRQISIIKTFHTHLHSMSSCSTLCADVLVLENCTVPLSLSLQTLQSPRQRQHTQPKHTYFMYSKARIWRKGSTIHNSIFLHCRNGQKFVCTWPVVNERHSFILFVVGKLDEGTRSCLPILVWVCAE